jgi:hypothetical protein
MPNYWAHFLFENFTLHIHMEEIIKLVAEDQITRSSARKYEFYHKYTSLNYDVLVRADIIEAARNKYVSLTASDSGINSSYAEFIREALLNCSIIGGEINIYAHPCENIDLADVKCASVHIKKNTIYNVNCYCVKMITYNRYYSCPHVCFEAVHVSYIFKTPIVGVKKIYVNNIVLAYLPYLMPDALILFCNNVHLTKFKICSLSEHILCYVSSDYICVNTAHSQYSLIEYYYSTLTTEYGQIIDECNLFKCGQKKHGSSKTRSFELIKTNIGRKLITDIDLESGALIKNAYYQ